MSKPTMNQVDTLGQTIEVGEYCMTIMHNDMRVCRVESIHAKSAKLTYWDSKLSENRTRRFGSNVFQRPFSKILMLKGQQLQLLVMERLARE